MDAHRWFVVAQYGATESLGHPPRPASLVHAKEMGTNNTACGVYCGTWFKWWSDRFPLAKLETCLRCLEVTGAVPATRVQQAVPLRQSAIAPPTSPGAFAAPVGAVE